MGKSVLILGGSYFIGKKIKEKLFSDGYQVYTLNRGTVPEENLNITNIKCDRNDMDGMKYALQEYNFDYIIDVSGLNKVQSEIACSAINLNSVEKYIFISSSAVYNIEDCEIPISEDSPLGENKYWGDYGTDKIEAEEYLKSIFQDINEKNSKKHELIILRPVYVYGDDNYAQRESYIFNQIVNNKVIVIPDEGETKLQFIYVNDLAGIVSHLLNIENIHETDNNFCSIYNVGNSDAVTINEWIKACEDAVGKQASTVKFDYRKENIGIREFFPFYDYDNVVDVSKINKICTYETDFQMGLEKSFTWYICNKQKINFKENVAQKTAEIANNEILKAFEEVLKNINIENSIPGEPQYNLEDILDSFDTDKLIKYCTAYESKSKKKKNNFKDYKKSELIEHLKKSIFDSNLMRTFFITCSKKTYDFFISLLPSDHMINSMAVIDDYFLLQRLGYIYLYYFNDKLYFLIPQEIKSFYENVSNKAFIEKRTQIDMIDSFAKASVSLYGIISIEEFKEIFKKFNKKSISHDDIFIFQEFELPDRGYCFYDEDIVSSEFKEDEYEDYHKNETKQFPIYIPPIKEFLKYEDYNYFEITPQILALKEFLIKDLYTDINLVDEIIAEIHILAIAETELQDLVDLLESYYVFFDDDDEQFERMIDLFFDVYYNTRIWDLNGHTRNEAMLINQKHTRSSKKNKNENYDYYEDYKDYEDYEMEKQETVVKSAKTGRNEPCPCGSGKKYKNCCIGK